MSAVKNLLDKAKDACEGHSYAALARRLEVTPQTVHQWKNGDVPMSAERIIELTKIARVPTDDWTLMVLSEQAKGAEKNVLERAVKRLGLSVAVVLCAVGLAIGSPAEAKQHKAFAVTSVENASGMQLMYPKKHRVRSPAWPWDLAGAFSTDDPPSESTELDDACSGREQCNDQEGIDTLKRCLNR